MNISKREFLKRLGIGGAALVGAPLAADEFVKTKNTLPPGSVGDPDNVWFGKNIFPLGHTIEDGPSCEMKDGKVVCPAREIPISFQPATDRSIRAWPIRLYVRPFVTISSNSSSFWAMPPPVPPSV